MIEGFS